jgi:prophage regulatory protein
VIKYIVDRFVPTRLKPSCPRPVDGILRRRNQEEKISPRAEPCPLADTTIYEMEQRGEFPRRFYLTSRSVVLDLAEIEEGLEQRRKASDAKAAWRAPMPDVRLRKIRPVKR